MGIVRRRARRRGMAAGMAAGAAMAGNRGNDQNAAEPAPQEMVQEPTPAADPTEELKKYAGLKDQGVITQEEFDAKKKELLNL